MKRQYILIATALFGLTACQDSPAPTAGTSPGKSPGEAYQNYLTSAAKGHSYADALNFHSIERQSEMISWIEAKSTKSGKTVEEYQNFFLSLTQEEGKCLMLEPLSEKTEGKSAVLTYKGKDICTTNSKAAITVSVNMVYEDQWKIRSEKVDITAK